MDTPFATLSVNAINTYEGIVNDKTTGYCLELSVAITPNIALELEAQSITKVGIKRKASSSST